MTRNYSKFVCLVLLLFASVAVRAGTITYVYTDPLGTPLAEADSNGNVTATFDYHPYGAQALGGKPSGPGYTGHASDAESGLVYMQARYYDPGMGRFLSIDPLAAAPGAETFGNRYSYADGNPILNTDPDGLETAIPTLPTVPVTGDVPRPPPRIIWVFEAPQPKLWGPLLGVSLFFVDANGFNDFVNGRQLCYGELRCSGQLSKPADAPVPGAVPGRATKGRTTQWEKPGGMSDAEKDFNDKNPTGVREIPGGGRVGTLPDGRTIIVRPTSTDGRPTLEIQSGGNKTKVRYGP